MAHPSDMAPALIALKAEVMIMSPDGREKVPLQEFFLGPNHYAETILKTDEFLTEIHVPIQSGRTHQVFLKERIRHSADFALCKCRYGGPDFGWSLRGDSNCPGRGSAVSLRRFDGRRSDQRKEVG